MTSISFPFAFPALAPLSGSNPLGIIHPNSVLDTKTFVPMVGFLIPSQRLGRKPASVQGLHCVTGEAVPPSILPEFKLIGWTQRGKGQGYFDLSHQWGHMAF